LHPPIFHRRFDYDRSLLPNAFLAQLEEGVTSIDEARLRSGASIGYPGWGAIYYLALCALDPSRPATIIETGANWGCSTIVLASALRAAKCGGHVHTIEIDPVNAEKAREHYRLAGVDDLITLHLGDSIATLPTVLRAVDDLSVVFLDGGHTFDLVKAEFDLIVGKLRPQGIVMMDNTYQIAEPGEDQRVNGFLKQLPAQHGGNIINLPFCSWFTPGLAIWQKSPF
jgi:predicted O-methyltransferase YrrM